MPMKPHKGESQSDFLSRCVPEMMSSGDREQEQAVAICMNIWRDKDADGTGVIRKETARPVLPNMEYVLSDGSIDRMGDRINPEGWDLSNFKRNNIALFNHDKNWPIGRWERVRQEGEKLIGKLKLAEEGTSQRIDEIISLIKQGILKAVSVGFLPKEREPLKDNSGVFFKKQELLEASIVSVPANPAALQLAKSLHVSDETLRVVFGEQATKDAQGAQRDLTGKQAAIPIPRKSLTMEPISTRIENAQGKVNSLRDELNDHISTAGDEPDDATLTVTDELNVKLASAQRHLDSLLEAEKQLASRSVQVIDVKANDDQPQRRPFAAPAEKIRDGEYFMRSLVATVVARARGWRPGLDNPEPFYRALSERFGQDGKIDEKTRAISEVVVRGEGENPLEVFNRVFGNAVQRAATAPATTITSGWASQLVTTGYQDFLALLLPSSVFPGLAARAMRMTFGRNGVVSIPTRVATPTISGSFVAEGSPIPVRQGAFSSQTFTPKKMGVISAFTREIAEHSTPAIEQLIRNAMQEDTAVSLDSVLLDNTAASTTRPAGIRNGVSGLTATAGGGFTALVGDIKQLTGALITGSAGNLRQPVWLMNPAQALSISLTQNAGGDFPFATEINGNRFTGYPVIVSGNITAGMVILLDAADFAVIEGGAPRFDVSDQAILHFEDTTPLQISTGAQGAGVLATPTRSLWQTDSMAIRMILDVNWGFVRTGTIAYTTSVTW